MKTIINSWPYLSLSSSWNEKFFRQKL